jgi:Phage portal protein
MPNIVDEIKQRIGATQVELSKYVKVQPIEIEDRKGFVTFGEGNVFPQYLIELYNESPVHGSIVNSIAFMIAGQNLSTTNPQAANEITRLQLDKLRHTTALDLKLHGGFYWEIIWSMDRSTIAQINHLPFENCRLCVSDDNDDVNGIYYSRDWNDTRKKKNIPAYIPMFNPDYKDEYPKQVMFVHSIVPGSEYYPKPDYISAVNNIELTRQISEYQVNLILNGFFPSLITSFNNGIPTLEEQRMIKNQLQQAIQGAENAGKVLTFFNEDRDRGVEFTPFPVSDMDKQFETLVSQAVESILVAHRVTSPLLFGIRDGGGLGSNTDEMKTAMHIFMKQVIEPFQRMITTSVEYLLDSEGITSDVSIVQNDLFIDAAPTTDATSSTPTDVASQALNGAQISSLLEIITQTTANVLTPTSAKAITKAAFPTMSDAQINTIFDNLSNVTLDPTQIAQKKKVKCEHESVSKTDAIELDSIADALIELGEEPNEDWILLDSYEVDYENDDIENEALAHIFDGIEIQQAVSTGTAKPNAKSDQDKVINGKTYYTRYRYSGRITSSTRPFCSKMLFADKLYRKEDILAMNNKAVNPGWGPHGADTYSCWLYKGGGNCHHIWQKELYISAKGFGLDLNNPNVQKKAWSMAEKAGYKIRNNYLVEQRPIDMPYNGFLPDNPRFGIK